MEAMVKKYQQRFRKVRDEMERWDELQTTLVSQFRNALSIIDRFQVLRDSKNFGNLSCIGGVGDAVLTRQMESLEKNLQSMRKTMEEFRIIVVSLEKINRDGRQMIKGGSGQASVKQLQQRVGIKPTLTECLDGLTRLYNMHHSEYLLKSSVVEVLPNLVFKPSDSVSSSLQQLLVDQPNIPKEEVQLIFDTIFAEALFVDHL